MHRLFTILIALVWLTNGLYCKVLHGVPRHELIVAKILGSTYAAPLTKAIGLAEIMMAIWVISRVQSRWCAIAQIVLVASMNALEFVLAPELLLFGRFNALNALLFTGLVAYNEFVLAPNAYTRS